MDSVSHFLLHDLLHKHDPISLAERRIDRPRRRAALVLWRTAAVNSEAAQSGDVASRYLCASCGNVIEDNQTYRVERKAGGAHVRVHDPGCQ